MHLQLLYLQIRKGKGQFAKYSAKDLNGGLRMGVTEDQGKPMDVSWLAIYTSEHAKARLRKAQLAALKANWGRHPSAEETKSGGGKPSSYSGLAKLDHGFRLDFG